MISFSTVLQLMFSDFYLEYILKSSEIFHAILPSDMSKCTNGHLCFKKLPSKEGPTHWISAISPSVLWPNDHTDDFCLTMTPTNRRCGHWVGGHSDYSAICAPDHATSIFIDYRSSYIVGVLTMWLTAFMRDFLFPLIAARSNYMWHLRI